MAAFKAKRALSVGLVLAGLASPATPWAVPAVAAPATRCAGAVTTDVVAGPAPGGGVALASGRSARLLDVRLRDGADGWLRGFAGRGVSVEATGPVDRWGRVPARLVLSDGGEGGDVAAGLVAAGFAVVDAGEQATLCRPDLLRTEASARERALGAWGAGPVVAGDDGEALAARIGEFVIVEGRVASVGERAGRAYINLGGDWSRALTVTVPKRDWAEFRARGTDAGMLRGRRVRVRGTLDVWRGPTVEIVVPDMLEIL